MKGKGLLLEILTAILLVSSLISTSLPKAEATSNLVYTLIHELHIKIHGSIFINDTITIGNSDETPIPLSSFAIEYPKKYFGSIANERIISPSEIESGRPMLTNTSTRIQFSLKQPIQVTRDRNLTINLQLYLTDLIEAVEADKYGMLLTLTPSLDKPLQRVESKIILPQAVSFLEKLEGFSEQHHPKLKILRGLFEKLEAHATRAVKVNIDASKNKDFSLISFQSVERLIKFFPVDPVTVEERIDIVNRGVGSASILHLSLLNEDAKSIRIIPEGDPPLLRAQTVTLTEGKIDLASTFKAPIERNHRLILRYDYPLPKSLVKQNGVIEALIPFKPPVEGVIQLFTVRFEGSSGVMLQDCFIVKKGERVELRGERSIRLVNSTMLEDRFLQVAFRPMLAWSSGDAIPAATIIFLLILVAMVYTSTAAKKAPAKAGMKALDDFRRLMDEKLISIQDSFSTLKGKDMEKVSRHDLNEVRRSLEAAKVRATSRIGELRSELTSQISDLKPLLDEIASADREYDRAARELFDLYERYYTSRLRKEVFEKLLPGHLRRIERLKEALDGLLEDLMRQL